MPDIFTGYPKEAIKFQQKGLLAKLDNYINSDELSKYVDSFIAEGRLGDNGLYVFPIAKSTEVLYVNQTLFDKFATETGVSIENLSTFEGIAELSEKYYSWTDSMTPNKKNDGKYFFTADSWFNVAEVGMAQLDDTIFNNDSISLKSNNYKYMFDNFYEPITQGGIAVYDGYSSDLSKTGDLVCSTGSSAGILFYGDTITHPDGSVEKVEYSILPYPVFKSGKNIALQRGGGLMVAKSTEQKEYAACEFIKWLTASEQNMKFIEKTGYLPVTKQAFETDISSRLEGLKDERIKKMLATVLSMYENYEFFTAPTYASFDSDSENYEKQYKKIMSAEQKNKLKGKKTSSKKAYVLLTK